MALRLRVAAPIAAATATATSALRVASVRGYRSDDNEFFRTAGRSYRKDDDAMDSSFAVGYVAPALLLAGGIALYKLNNRSTLQKEALERLESTTASVGADLKLKRQQLELLAKDDSLQKQLDAEVQLATVPHAAIPALSWNEAAAEEVVHHDNWESRAREPKHPRDFFFGAGSGPNEYRDKNVEQGLVRMELEDNRPDASPLASLNPANWFKGTATATTQFDASNDANAKLTSNAILQLEKDEGLNKSQNLSAKRKELEAEVAAREKELSLLKELHKMRESVFGRKDDKTFTKMEEKASEDTKDHLL